jgi:hypothetical protein
MLVPAIVGQWTNHRQRALFCLIGTISIIGGGKAGLLVPWPIRLGIRPCVITLLGVLP